MFLNLIIFEYEIIQFKNVILREMIDKQYLMGQKILLYKVCS